MRLILFFFFLLFLIPQWGKAQIAPLNSIFTRSPYGFYSQDSDNYLYPSVNSYAELTSLIDSICPFQTSDFFTNLSEVMPNSGVQLLYGLHNQVPWKDTEFTEMRSSYTFKNKSSYWYGFYKKSWADTNTAFLVIPGSGSHEAIKIASGDVNDYHNFNGRVRDKCLSYGDMYVYSKQNECFNGIWKNAGGTYSLLDYDFFTPFTDLGGNHWAANMYIDLVAAVKYLKSRYQKVIIMGLSNAGFPALVCGLTAEADGINCASGISSWSYNGFLLPNNENPYFANLFNVYTFDSLKGLMQKHQSEVLFSYGSGDGGGNAFEYSTHALEDTFANQCNAKFFYGFAGHTFPTNYYDTFFTKVIKQPKVSFTTDTTVCTVDSLLLSCHFTGQAPFTFHLLRNDTLVQQMTVNDTLAVITLHEAGSYCLSQLVDQHQSPLCKTQTFHYQKDQLPVLDSIRYSGRDCALQADLDKIYLRGRLPISVMSDIPGSTFITSSTPQYTYALPNGTYHIISLEDAHHCKSYPQDTIVSQRDAISLTVQSQVYDCDSMMTRFGFTYTGTSPWTLQYQLSGQAAQQSSVSVSDTLYTKNGLLYLVTLTDSTGCSYPVNQVYAVNRDTVNASFEIVGSPCDSTATATHFHCKGQSPWTVTYSANGVFTQFNTVSPDTIIYLPNGEYILQEVTDGQACHRFLQDTLQIESHPVAINIGTPIYHCDSLKASVHFTYQGVAPFTVQYTKNGVPQQWTSNQLHQDLYFSNGIYLIHTVTDSHNCTAYVNGYFSVQFQPISLSIDTPVYECLTNTNQLSVHATGNAPYLLQYMQNSTLQTLTMLQTDTLLHLGNGNYSAFHISDQTACAFTASASYTFANNTLQAWIQTPVYDCDSSKMRIHFDVNGNPPFILSYYENLIAKQLVTTQTSFDMYLGNGSYFFYQLSDAKLCSINLSVVYQFQTPAISASIIQQLYNCDTDKYQIKIGFTGLPPFNLQFSNGLGTYTLSTSQNTATLNLNNGTWILHQVTDAHGCVFVMADTIVVNYQPLSVTLGAMSYDCDSNQSVLPITFNGNPPYYVQAQFNGNPINWGPFYTNQNLYLSNGQYFILSVTDSTQCLKTINQMYLINNVALQAQELQEGYDCDSARYEVLYQLQGNSPWYFHYHNSSQIFVDTVYSSLWHFHPGNGIWYIDEVTDTRGCHVTIQDTVQIQTTPLAAAITSQQYNCNTLLYDVDFALQGDGPWIISYIKYGASPQSFVDTVSIPNPQLSLSLGVYGIVSVSDAHGCITLLNQIIIQNYDTLTFQYTKHYDCDLHKMKLAMHQTGNGPWLLHYQDVGSGLTFTQNINTNNDTLLLNNGTYVLTTIDDANCSLMINDTVLINIDTLQAQLQTAVVDCDSGKYKMTLLSTGGVKPITLSYIGNGVAQSISTYTNATSWLLDNGNYYFIEVKDSLNCIVPLNLSQQYHYTPYQWQGVSTTYLCDKDSTRIDFQMSLSQPVQLMYTNPLGVSDSLWLPTQQTILSANGVYQWLYLRDSIGCTDTLFSNLAIDNHPLLLTDSLLERDCVSRDYVYYFDLQGKAPWTLFYNKDNQPNQVVFNASPILWKVGPGMYNLYEIQDANNCVINPYWQDTLLPFLTPNPFLSIDRHHLYTESVGTRYFWYYNGVCFDSTNHTHVLSQGNGFYYVDVQDAGGCIYRSNEVMDTLPEGATLYPNPVSDLATLLVNLPAGASWSYRLFDMQGQCLDAQTSTQHVVEFHWESLAAGVYQLMVYTPNAQKQLIRFTKL
ncbi:MAG: hypothetical protein RIQ62_507 [Bacteroidota bacterium]